ncbi:hypothetical protein D3C71_1351470 [compost metagenome]
MQHACPQVDANRVVGALAFFLAFFVNEKALPCVVQGPIRGVAFGGGSHDDFFRTLNELPPGREGVERGQPLHDLQRHIAWVEFPSAFGLYKAAWRREQARPQAREVCGLLCNDAGGQTSPQGAILRGVPQACRLAQDIGNPDVSVGGRIVVNNAPGSVRPTAPQPRGQACAQVSAAQVVLGPAQEGVETLAVIGDQGKEKSVSLAFRVGAPSLPVVRDHPAFLAGELGLEGIPGRPLTAARQTRHCALLPLRA